MLQANSDTYLTLLQITSMPPGPGLPSPATLLFNYPVRGSMLVANRAPIN